MNSRDIINFRVFSGTTSSVEEMVNNFFIPFRKDQIEVIIKPNISEFYAAIKLIPENDRDHEELRKLSENQHPLFRDKIETDFHSVEKEKIISTSIIVLGKK